MGLFVFNVQVSRERQEMGGREGAMTCRTGPLGAVSLNDCLSIIRGELPIVTAVVFGEQTSHVKLGPQQLKQ